MQLWGELSMRLLRLISNCSIVLMSVSLQENLCSSPPTESQPTEATLCVIQSDPESYDKKSVSFDGRIRSDGTHYIGADDARCPKKMVGLLLPHSSNEHDGINALRSAIFSGAPGTIDKDISARVTGRVKVDPEGRPPIVIQVIKVENIKVTAKTQ